MAAYKRKKTPDFFEDNVFDPINLAIGPDKPHQQKNRRPEEGKKGGACIKKKAGFYLSTDILDRFTRKFHELKLAGINIDNKSMFMEIAIALALDDIDKGSESSILKQLGFSGAGKPSPSTS